MEILPSEIRLQEIWRSLPYSDIVYLCQTNTEFNKICQNNSTWEDLYIRDFGLYDARNLYILSKQALDRFSSIYPIITQRALQTIVNLIPVFEWDKLELALRANNEQFIDKILTFAMLEISIIDTYDEDTEKRIMPQTYRDIITKISDIHLAYPNFDFMVEELNQSNCDKLKEIISRPTLIFVNKRPISIKYDYELAKEFVNYTYHPASESCYQQVKQIEEEILSLL